MSKVIIVGGLPEKRRAIAAFNGTIDILKRDRPDKWEETIDYLEDVQFKIVEAVVKPKRSLGPRLPVFGRRS